MLVAGTDLRHPKPRKTRVNYSSTKMSLRDLPTQSAEHPSVFGLSYQSTHSPTKQSLNDNENVRNCLNENIYRVGGLDLDWIGGGFLWRCYG